MVLIIISNVVCFSLSHANRWPIGIDLQSVWRTSRSSMPEGNGRWVWICMSKWYVTEVYFGAFHALIKEWRGKRWWTTCSKTKTRNGLVCGQHVKPPGTMAPQSIFRMSWFYYDCWPFLINEPYELCQTFFSYLAVPECNIDFKSQSDNLILCFFVCLFYLTFI